MKDFKKGGFRAGFRDKNRGGRQGGFSGGKPNFGNRDKGAREDREMFEAVCSECGNSCEVPFRPSGDKPVLCNDCFGGNRQNYSQQTRRNNDRYETSNKGGDRPDPRINELNHTVSELSNSIRDILEKLNSIESALIGGNAVAEVNELKTTKKPAAKKATKKVVSKTK